MGDKRFLDQLLSVFDLTICKAIELPESVSTRVMFRCEGEGGHTETLVSNNGLQRDLVDQVTLWLEKNLDLPNITLILTPKKEEIRY